MNEDSPLVSPLISPLILVTGATDGIGLATARALAHRNARIVVHGRTPEKARAAVEEIQRVRAESVAGSVSADFESLDEVRRMAAELRERFPDLSVLINNAGIYSRRGGHTRDGNELTFGVNHLAPFLLTLLLLDVLKANAPSRVINVSSTLHQGASEPTGETSDGYAAYGSSKLANVLFTVELAERLKGTGVTVNALHPGGVATKLLHAGFGGGGIPVEQGAETPVYLAIDADVAATSGGYFANRRPASMDPRAQNAAMRRRLWQLSERLTGLS